MIDKLKIFTILGIVLFVIFLIATNLRSQELENIKIINQNFKFTKGLVIKKSVYKGRSISVKYNINNKIYIVSDGISESDKVKEGDSINLKYSVTKPELMITEFNVQY